MKSVGGNLYLEFSDLVRAGIKHDTVKAAKHRGSQGWDFIPDPADKRRVLVLHQTLKPQVKAVVDTVLAAELAATAMGDIKELVQVSPSDLHALRAFRFGEDQSLPAEHIEKYARACAYLRVLTNTDRATQKRLGCPSAAVWNNKVITCIKSEGLDLPTNYSNLRQKVRQFNAQGVAAVVSSRFGNQNRRKISGTVNAWLIAQYALPTKPDVAQVGLRYQHMVATKSWPALTVSAIYQHLTRSEVEQQWYLGRHGEKAWKAKYGHTLKLRPVSCRDAMWVGDGTKMNIYCQVQGKMDASTQMYIIIDAFSEAILGWSLGASETMAMQYDAAKMALRFSQARPLQWLYDNQGGHKSAAGQDFYTRAAKHHFAAQPYNAKRKPVERIIGHFQRHIMAQHWAFTGQNITAKSIDSRANMEFIMAHKDQLPQREQLPTMLQAMVDAWNNAPHPRIPGSRVQAYRASINPEHQPLDPLDMVELFWITTKENVYRKDGLTITVNGARHTYEVYDAAGMPDEDFRTRYLNARFVVRHDPETMDCIVLYRTDDNGDLRQVAVAQPKQTVGNAVVDLRPGDRAIIDFSLALRERELALAGERLKEHQTLSGVDPEMLVAMAPYGAPKADVDGAEAAIYTQGMRPVACPADDDDDTSISPFDV